MDLIQKEAHKKLFKKMYDCKCKPWSRVNGYCGVCKGAVINFMNEHGAGILCRDIELEELEKGYARLFEQNEILSKKLDKKALRVEELKEKLLQKAGEKK